MSPREEVQIELIETLNFLGLNEVYGIIEGKDKNKAGHSYRSLTFCRAQSVDGSIMIYSPKFIVIKWQTTIRTLNHKGQEVFKSLYDAKCWLTKNFAC